jgi:acyl-CoA synthetase (AMP-forming)/AMP-acid ligase II
LNLSSEKPVSNFAFKFKLHRYSTGDLATVRSDGYICLVDRKKDMILCGGENVYTVRDTAVLYSLTLSLIAPSAWFGDSTLECVISWFSRYCCFQTGQLVRPLRRG